MATRVLFCFPNYGGTPQGDELLAIFLDIPWDNHGNLTSYARVGQHGGCNPVFVSRQYRRLATPEEYAPLLAELRGLGYTELEPVS